MTQNGDYFVKVTQANNCSNSSDTLEVTDYSGTGTSNLVASEDVSIFPNPTSGELYIKSPVAINATLYSLDGRIVYNQKNASVIMLAHVSNGVYFLHVTDKEGNHVKRSKVVVTK